MQEIEPTMPVTDLWENPAALALVEAEVERAVAPYAGMMSPERLDAMRAHIRDALLVHPVLSRTTALAVPGPVVAASEVVDSDPATAAEAKKNRGDGG